MTMTVDTQKFPRNPMIHVQSRSIDDFTPFPSPSGV
jgi:hypothetical protein